VHTTPVTTRDALRRAFWMVKLPSMVLLIGPLLGMYLAMKWGWLPSRGISGLKWFGPIFLFAFVGGWLVWSLQVSKWRLWAYERVDDIQELKAAAVATQVVWPDHSIFTRTEIARHATWVRIRKLEAEKLHGSSRA
jgi:hypothetical protein